jgi:hypothetical protein
MQRPKAKGGLAEDPEKERMEGRDAESGGWFCV